MHEKAKCVCFIYMQPQKVKFKYAQVNMKQVLYVATFLRQETGKVVWVLSFEHLRIRINTLFKYSYRSCSDIFLTK